MCKWNSQHFILEVECLYHFRLFQALPDRYNSYLLDLRNHGSSPHIPSMSLSSLAGDVLNVVKTLNEETKSDGIKPVIVGHSLGGKTAMMTALLFPDLVIGLFQ
jgi:esterase